MTYKTLTAGAAVRVSWEGDGGCLLAVYSYGESGYIQTPLTFEQTRELSDYLNEMLLQAGEYQELVPTSKHDLPSLPTFGLDEDELLADPVLGGLFSDFLDRDPTK